MLVEILCRDECPIPWEARCELAEQLTDRFLRRNDPDTGALAPLLSTSTLERIAAGAESFDRFVMADYLRELAGRADISVTAALLVGSMPTHPTWLVVLDRLVANPAVPGRAVATFPAACASAVAALLRSRDAARDVWLLAAALVDDGFDASAGELVEVAASACTDRQAGSMPR